MSKYVRYRSFNNSAWCYLRALRVCKVDLASAGAKQTSLKLPAIAVRQVFQLDLVLHWRHGCG